MNKKILRGIGSLMLLFAIGFVLYALNHPELSFPWGNEITYGIYGAYTVVLALCMIAPVNN